MTQHYGQHPICAACDAAARGNTPEARELARKRSEAANRARTEALAGGASQAEADRAGSLAAGEVTP